MSILYFIVVFILLCQWIYWLISRYPEIRKMRREKKRIYRLGALSLFIVSLILSYVLAQAAAVMPVSQMTSLTFITTLFIGLVCILCLRVYIMNSRQVFRSTCYSGMFFSFFLIAMELFCFIMLL
ncbi:MULTISPECIES: hypothetical protein [unclassified Paenibacillus]|uniref:hypothetical protein n=1 Tax=unclassified Paenibacillus TaxID=185978 RepID=UPI0036277F7E